MYSKNVECDKVGHSRLARNYDVTFCKPYSDLLFL